LKPGKFLTDAIVVPALKGFIGIPGFKLENTKSFSVTSISGFGAVQEYFLSS
jgi:hypothetical protein